MGHTEFDTCAYKLSVHLQILLSMWLHKEQMLAASRHNIHVYVHGEKSVYVINTLTFEEFI